MPVLYDPDFDGLVVFDAFHCGQDMYDTGCSARGCFGYVCLQCGEGCDIELDPEGGFCAASLEAESESDFKQRVDAERRALGLPELSEEEGGDV